MDVVELLIDSTNDHQWFSYLKNYFSDQRNLGMSMKVERSTLEQVRARFDKNKRKREDDEKNKVSIYSYFSLLLIQNALLQLVYLFTFIP